MKKLLVVVIILLLVGFLVVTNPTTEEFASWYAEKSCPSQDNLLDGLLGQFTESLATKAQRDNYGIFSVFTHKEYKTLGIGLMFFPLDELNSQIKDFRDTYANWLEEYVSPTESGD